MGSSGNGVGTADTDMVSAAPTPRVASPSEIVEHFFRHETGRLHGALTRMLGPGNLALVEDVTQGALLQAMRNWSMGGVPANPSAWITRVAINLARDAVRHRRMALGKEDGLVTHHEQLQVAAPLPGESEPEIREDTLRLMFVCCHPELASDAQVILALKVLGGFSTGEIARAFFSSEAAIEKQVTRTKERIRELGIGFEIPVGPALGARIDGVLATLYLMFNEGYKASAGEHLLREELCLEAVRLTSILVAHPAGDLPRAHALLALMLLNAARFPARVDDHGDLLRLDDQDRTKWDARLIGRGLHHLARAACGTEVSEYHLQAGIAACHCTAPDHASTDWARILRLYDDLLRLNSSPVIALNRAVAVASMAGPRAGLDAIATIPRRERLEGNYLLHSVMGELYWRLGDCRASAASFRQALQLAHVGPEVAHLTRMVERATPR